MNITLKQLKAFVSVAQTGSVTEAAEKNCLSKPALSISLTELEKQLDCKLFYRQNNRLILNDTGKMLLPLADEILKRVHDIGTLVKQPAQSSLIIGGSKTIGNYLLPFLISDFTKCHNGIKTSLSVNNTQSICEALNRFEIDLALVEGQVHSNTLHTSPWLQDDMVIICSPKNSLAKNKKLTFKSLAKSPWLLREKGSGTRQYFEQQVAGKLTSIDIAYELASTQAIINSVAADLGISCVSKHAITSEIKAKNIVQLSFVLPKRQYWLVYHKDKYQAPALQSFTQFCQSWKNEM